MFDSEISRDIPKAMVQRWRASKPLLPGENRQRIPYAPADFEMDLQRLLDHCLPFSCLPGIQIFSPKARGERDFGTEMDHLLHFKMGGTDYLVVIEAKLQTVEVDRSRWWVSYGPDRKDACGQVDRQVRTLWEYLRPIAAKTDLRFLGVVASVDPEVESARHAGHLNSTLALVPVAGLMDFLVEFFNLREGVSAQAGVPLRVSQSPFLSLLRLSCPLPALGHPELKSAIAYVDRCRRSLDESIYKDFTPTQSHWAINGSAGMGKSVLLAYAAAVFCSGYRLDEFQGEMFPVKANDIFKKTGFKNDQKLSIGILAMSAKQLENLRHWFQFFVDCFQSRDETGEIRFRKPDFILVRTLDELTGRKWSALLVDECHDIPAAAERTLVESHHEHGFVLVVACDRHQKLRYAADDARILNGLDFSLRTKRLKQNYRNPAPINIASLGLMFRWFAEGGHKVIPNKEQLENQFGFIVEGDRVTGYRLSLRSDAHPANAWAHTVASFTDANSAFRHLVEAHLSETDVLWARFSEEDLDFNYEELGRRFIYHNCRSHDAHKISDKYIKGQDYPVVVIEGFPGFMDRATSPDEEEKMWSFRRELYLCASRATCFLYFVVSERQTLEVRRIQRELSNLVASLAVPANFGKGGTKAWEFQISPPEVSRSLEVFRDNEENDGQQHARTENVSVLTHEPTADPVRIEPTQTAEPSYDSWELWVQGPITVEEFAAEIGIKPFQVLAQLIKMKIFADPKSLIEMRDLMVLTARYGGTLRHYDEEPEEVELGVGGEIRALPHDVGGDQDSITQVLKTVELPVGSSMKESGGEHLAERGKADQREDSIKPKPKVLDLISDQDPPRQRILDLITDGPAPCRQNRAAGLEEGKHAIAAEPSGGRQRVFRIGGHAVETGSWIEETNYGIGRILRLNTRPGYADSHRVWFAESKTTISNHPLRGRVSKIIPESLIPEEIRLACPPPPWD